PPSGSCKWSVGHVTEIIGHVPEFGGHDAETVGHALPKYALLQRHTDQPISRLARWIVDRQIVTFEANSQRWIPMFQFEATDMRVLDGVSRSILELRDVFDDPELAEWFGTPNIWLTGRTPAELVRQEAHAVVEAARADRFVVSG
ncbi:MbcA/ParS/Xre antitoxin family protein, partial [Variovorax sp. GT1P44]|uniref:MbcA/ParS/Xre antitoxin family protein n=1 Tax=Variovorax sp. GT1P44 TaxID=3443742 RepID=UPI003F46BA5F